MFFEIITYHRPQLFKSISSRTCKQAPYVYHKDH